MSYRVTRPEARVILLDLKELLIDEHETWLAGLVEDVLVRLLSMDREACQAYADFILPRGRRGRVRLTLSRPYEARVFAFLAGILRSIE